jgi:hypothetical protein
LEPTSREINKRGRERQRERNQQYTHYVTTLFLSTTSFVVQLVGESENPNVYFEGRNIMLFACLSGSTEIQKKRRKNKMFSCIM